MQQAAQIMKNVASVERDGEAWFLSQDVAIALGVRPEKITRQLPLTVKRRIKVGSWPMERIVTGINADGLTLVWRMYGMIPIHEFCEWLNVTARQSAAR